MSMDLTGITNQNEYYTNHYFASIFEENASDTIAAWRAEAKGSKEIRTPWSLLKECAHQYYPIHDRYVRSRFDMQTLQNIKALADSYLHALGYPAAKSDQVVLDENLTVPVYHEETRANGAPLLWVILAAAPERDMGALDRSAFAAADLEEAEPTAAVYADLLTNITNEDLATKILFSMDEPPRFLLFIGMNQIALIDRNKWNEKRYLQFELEEIFSRREETTLQAMAVLLHKDSICPQEGAPLLDTLDANSQKHAAGVSQDLKYALRESIELLGNEVIYYAEHHPDELPEYQKPLDSVELTLECLRYMYRMLFVLFIEARPELGYAPIKAQSYLSGYSLESLRDIADNIREDVDEVGEGYFLHETLAKLYDLIYNGYPATEEDIHKYSGRTLHDMFIVPPLKAHIFDPERTKLITHAQIRNSCMLRIIDLMSLTRATGKKNSRRGRISYANLGINQLGAVYEALLSYRGFIAETALYEVKRAGDKFDELDVGYFVREDELDQYEEDERVRYESGEKKGKLRMYKKGSFIYRLAGREREKSASYYTPEVLTKCLVKYALKELLAGKSADEILNLTICEPAMGSAAFLNEAISQLAEAYIDKKQKELHETISYEQRFTEVQKVKMYIADRNVYGIDLNPIAVELAEVSLWLNTIYAGGFVPWFGTQLVNGNSLIGARRQCYAVDSLKTTVEGLHWYEDEPERVPLGTKRKQAKQAKGKRQIWHFLLGDPGMCNYKNVVIKSLEPDNMKLMNKWKKQFSANYNEGEIETLLRLSVAVDELWDKQVELRKKIDAGTQDTLSVFGHEDHIKDSHTTIRQKDKIYSELYKSENMKNAGPYARLKFAMDYWCALWFWPIEKAELLPTRSEFFFDMSLILEGTMKSAKSDYGQLSLFPTENDNLVQEIMSTYGDSYNEVDIPSLRAGNPRLNLAAEIAEHNHFVHWELEFADLFAEKGGFDLIIGNPPWIKTEWKEQAAIGDTHPLFVIRELSSTQTTSLRNNALDNIKTKRDYFSEYTSIAGQQLFLNAKENYPLLVGMKANLYKCFLPIAWMFSSSNGYSGFVHQEGVYDDPKGGALRKEFYARLCKHFQFENELHLFEGTNDHGKMKFSLNVYGSPKQSVSFEQICNLFAPNTIEECYYGEISPSTEIPGIKDEHGNWNTKGHPLRIVHIGQKELATISKLFDPQSDWQTTILPQIHAEPFIKTLSCFLNSKRTVGQLMEDEVYTTQFWNETTSQDDGIIEAKLDFPSSPQETILSSAQIGIANPFFQTTRRVYLSNNDYDRVDLTEISDSYLPRNRYQPACSCSWENYKNRIPVTPWGAKVSDEYHLLIRRRVGTGSERTLTCAIAALGFAHVNTVISISLKNSVDMITLAGTLSSIPFDFVIKCLGRSDIYFSSLNCFPLIAGKLQDEIVVRTLILNCLTKPYSHLWESSWKDVFCSFSWTKHDIRLNQHKYENLTKEWSSSIPLKTEYERRQALVEIDVLTAMAIGMTLEELIAIYQAQFPLLRKSEDTTWYDATGRITFSTSGIQTGVGFDRKEWKSDIKGAQTGKRFYRTITDDTMPGGPIERIIEYVAPFDRCDREKDYETAWKFFAEKYGEPNA